DQSYQHPIDKITMQTFGTAVIDHILHHIVHKVLVAYGFEKPFDCKTMPSHILLWQQSVLRLSLHHNTQLLNASIYYQTSFSHIHNYIPLLTSCRLNLQNSPCKLKSGGDRQRESLGCFPSPETKKPADLKDQLAFLFAHKENALLRFYKYNKYTKHNSIPTKHLKIMFFDKVH